MGRKITALAVLVAALVALALPAQAPAGHTLAHKVKQLTTKLNKINAKLNCLQRYPVASFEDFAMWEPGASVPVVMFPIPEPPDTPEEVEVLPDLGEVSGIDFAYGSLPKHAWFLGVNMKKKGCLGRFGIASPALAAQRKVYELRLSRIQ